LETRLKSKSFDTLINLLWFLVQSYDLKETNKVILDQEWPSCLWLGSTRKFLDTHDQPVGSKVTSTKCHKMQ